MKSARSSWTFAWRGVSGWPWGLAVLVGCGGAESEPDLSGAVGGTAEAGAPSHPGTRVTGGAAGRPEAAAEGGDPTGGEGSSAGGAAGAPIPTQPTLWVEVDSTHYRFMDIGTARLHNRGTSTAYVPACPVADLQLLTKGEWSAADKAPSTCPDTVTGVSAVGPGGSLDVEFSFWDPDLYLTAGKGRLLFSIGTDCGDAPTGLDPCSRVTEILSPEFEIDECVCPDGICPSLDVLCDEVRCPPATFGAALAVLPHAVYQGCGQRFAVHNGPPNGSSVYAFDLATGDIVGACIAYSDLPAGPCYRSRYSAGDLTHLGSGCEQTCPDAVACSFEGDFALPESWSCP